jgi:Zn-dependent peptidase ImmA (M78 family)
MNYGFYIIEDMEDNDVLKFREYFKQYFTDKIVVKYMLMPVGEYKGDNNLIILNKIERSVARRFTAVA